MWHLGELLVPPQRLGSFETLWNGREAGFVVRPLVAEGG